MAEIIRVYRQKTGASRFIGKRYGDADRVDGSFGAKWGEWMNNDWFKTVASQYDGDLTAFGEDGGCPVGMMRDTPEGAFEYWIGVFMPEDTAVPEGFEHVDFPAGHLGVCWVCGKEEDIYMREGECGERLEREGYKYANEWCFERYAKPRFDMPDENGNIILDICFFVE